MTKRLTWLAIEELALEVMKQRKLLQLVGEAMQTEALFVCPTLAQELFSAH